MWAEKEMVEAEQSTIYDRRKRRNNVVESSSGYETEEQ